MTQAKGRDQFVAQGTEYKPSYDAYASIKEVIRFPYYLKRLVSILFYIKNIYKYVFKTTYIHIYIPILIDINDFSQQKSYGLRLNESIYCFCFVFSVGSFQCIALCYVKEINLSC